MIQGLALSSTETLDPTRSGVATAAILLMKEVYASDKDDMRVSAFEILACKSEIPPFKFSS